MTLPLHEDSCYDSRIRPIEPANIADLIEIADATGLSPWTAQNYLDELQNENSIMLRLMADDNSIIGFVVGRLVAAAEPDTVFDAEIYNIAVIEPEQRKGCGQTLFDAFRGICGAREVGSIWLEVRESNRKAIRFYERNGFSPVQTRSHFYENPREHAILMRRILK